ncbi:PREDICTED: E3 ubiquitin ligase BIG BROTHER-like [Nelumbo nucifera]|uniref:E3 ubiquitin ligase BIG BROTHER-like n=1 Tax=Nelumbo nucifera TaxID=4432 RepID=A0A1U7ZSL8_NELNU|nr:PREDICTED: E3 ubiquitin ligase BIG BROTHER-like [Nelumbo nucifera]XP_010257295.1 PREDICTED: E3 ubiquitin ligase BIG BROTHER-like [Nelumbo nucifera]XP_010257296.1 PREDICTED: E3 ubiquitin ligase BIG BROTHER-like [Nelumbo nucifera]XP_010257297.1 PREDICTED: E3 ubiquitin ligase BIG BROTHER-like [Nelumbo nucifera]
MNGNRQMEVHYINTGFPYTITESFMDLFEGLTYAQADFSLGGAMHDQESAYWSMHANSYKFGLSGPGTTSYYGHNYTYEVNDHIPRMEPSGQAWENSAMMSNEELTPVDMRGGNGSTTTHVTPEDCIRNQNNTSSSQMFWQDNIDPDNMTYEELLDLGEAVGTHSRGLSQEQILQLPISKYKCGFFSRKRFRGERCVICQMEYKRGDRQMTLPCKHIYHGGCITRWLSINKACPVCYTEVVVKE